MKKLKHLFFAVLILSINACEDELTLPAGNCVEVKVVTELCNQAVLQVQGLPGNELELGSIEINGVSYDNVFKTFFHCQQMDDVLTDDSTFHIRPIDEAAWQALITQPDDCIVCEPLLAGSLPFSYVEIVENCAGSINR